jgi:hypothetical protein
MLRHCTLSGALSKTRQRLRYKRLQWRSERASGGWPTVFSRREALWRTMASSTTPERRRGAVRGETRHRSTNRIRPPCSAVALVRGDHDALAVAALSRVGDYLAR